MQSGGVGVDAADDLERDQSVRGHPELRYVLGLGVPGGGEQVGQDVADGLAFVAGVGGRQAHSTRAVHELIEVGVGQGEVEVGRAADRIEVSSAAAVAWQFAGSDPQRRERVALRAIAWSFFALAAYVVVEAVRGLLGAGAAERSPVGIVLVAVSVIVMPVVSFAQRRAGRELGSATAVADSKQTLLCTYLSAAVLVGLVLNAGLGWWWGRSRRRFGASSARSQRRTQRPARRSMLRAVAALDARRTWRGLFGRLLLVVNPPVRSSELPGLVVELPVVG